MSGGLTRFLGDSPARVFVKLLILSLIVGVVMSTIGWSPRDIYQGVVNFFQRLWNLGFDAVFSSLEYLLIGAAVVVPVFLVLRILSFRSPRS
ncbi:MAG: DUF6460 domain-containing protein [Pseudomonadota bacterium]